MNHFGRLSVVLNKAKAVLRALGVCYRARRDLADSLLRWCLFVFTCAIFSVSVLNSPALFHSQVERKKSCRRKVCEKEKNNFLKFLIRRAKLIRRRCESFLTHDTACLHSEKANNYLWTFFTSTFSTSAKIYAEFVSWWFVVIYKRINVVEDLMRWDFKVLVHISWLNVFRSDFCKKHDFLLI